MFDIDFGGFTDIDFGGLADFEFPDIGSSFEFPGADSFGVGMDTIDTNSFDFFSNFDVVTSPDQSGWGLGEVALPQFDPSTLPESTGGGFLDTLYGSINTALKSIIDGAAQRVTSSGETVGSRIAQPTPTQAATATTTAPSTPSFLASLFGQGPAGTNANGATMVIIIVAITALAFMFLSFRK